MKKLATIILGVGLMAALSPLALAQQHELEGIYVQCPKNSLENCPGAAAEFKAAFPGDQIGPYLMIRKDGGGYLAPNEKVTTDFTWQLLGDNAILLKMDDAKRSHVKYQTDGDLLVNIDSKDIFVQSIPDSEWNKAPVKAKKKKARSRPAEEPK